MNLRDKVCIVTGAASGIGKAIAARFAREGGKVAVADLQMEAAHRTVAEVEATGGTAVAIAMDVTDEAQVHEGVARVVAMWGGVDVLVSNAGVPPFVHCREQIAGFKVPRCIELRTEPLPKSAAGKILKRELREPHWAGQQAQVSGG